MMQGGPTGDVSGYVAAGFQPVQQQFAETCEGDRGGSAIAIIRDGETVVDLWCGFADDTVGRPWERDTRAVMFSATKGVVALCAADLVGRGLLNFDALVTQYWPEYSANNKQSTTIRHALSHRAGVPTLDAVLPRELALSWLPVTEALAHQQPLWEPGSAYGYHALTYGWLAGEVIRRITGHTLRRWLHDQLAAPRRLEVNIGLPVHDQDNVAAIVAPIPPPGPTPVPGPAEQVENRAVSMNGILTFPGTGPHHSWNDPDFLAAELPGANGISTARDLALLYAAASSTIAQQPPFLSPSVLADAMLTQSEGPDWVNTPGPSHRWGTGFILSNQVRPMFGATSFGHDGAGGQLAFADLATHSSFAYLTSRMGADDDTRANRLAATALSCMSIS